MTEKSHVKIDWWVLKPSQMESPYFKRALRQRDKTPFVVFASFVCLFWFLLSLWSKSMDSDWKEIHSIYIRGYCESSVDLSMHSGARIRIGVISIANHEWATKTWNFQWVCSQSSDVRIANRKVFFILQQNDLKRCTNAIFFEMFQFCTAAFFRVCCVCERGNLSVP